jgi:hypothetical protein
MTATATGRMDGFTEADLLRLPPDANRHELFEGLLVVSPPPFTPHNRAGARLARLLEAAAPPDVEVLQATTGVRLPCPCPSQPTPGCAPGRSARSCSSASASSVPRAAHPGRPPLRRRAGPLRSTLPVDFVQNRGQWGDPVAFAARTGG